MGENKPNYAKLKEYLRLYTYYILIGILSLMATIVFPMLNSMADIVGTFPQDSAGWTMYIIIRALIIVMNMLIFSLFIQQARINIKDDENFKKANEILGKFKPKEYRPRSVKEFIVKEYAKKGTTLAITSVASLFVIGNAVINYDYMLLIATVFTVIMSVVFGIIEMKKVELYYITEYLDYAINIEKNANQLKKGDFIKCLNSITRNLET